MKDKNGVAMLPVWKSPGWEWINYVAAPTKAEAARILKVTLADISRFKGVYATGKPREL